jgi:hypothetical protein
MGIRTPGDGGALSQSGRGHATPHLKTHLKHPSHRPISNADLTKELQQELKHREPPTGETSRTSERLAEK